jgi:hypothetical protein
MKTSYEIRLRDEFARAALGAMLAKGPYTYECAKDETELSSWCYRIADALMFRRQVAPAPKEREWPAP